MTKIREPGWGSGGRGGWNRQQGSHGFCPKGMLSLNRSPQGQARVLTQVTRASDFLKRIEKSTCFYKVS